MRPCNNSFFYVQFKLSAVCSDSNLLFACLLLCLCAGGYLFAVVDPLETLVSVWSANRPCCRPRPELALPLPHPPRRPFCFQGVESIYLFFAEPIKVQMKLNLCFRCWPSYWCPISPKSGLDSPFVCWTAAWACPT